MVDSVTTTRPREPDVFVYGHFQEFANDLFSRRRQRNPRYSLRAFARDIGLSASFTLAILTAKRRPSLDTICDIAEKIGLNAQGAEYLFWMSQLPFCTSEIALAIAQARMAELRGPRAGLHNSESVS